VPLSLKKIYLRAQTQGNNLRKTTVCTLASEGSLRSGESSKGGGGASAPSTRPGRGFTHTRELALTLEKLNQPFLQKQYLRRRKKSHLEWGEIKRNSKRLLIKTTPKI